MTDDASLEPPRRAFSLTRCLVAEAMGTALLLAVVVGSGIMGETLAEGNAAIALLGNIPPTIEARTLPPCFDPTASVLDDG